MSQHATLIMRPKLMLVGWLIGCAIGALLAVLCPGADRLLLLGGSTRVDSRIVPLLMDSFAGTSCADDSARVSDGLFDGGAAANTWIKAGGAGVQWTKAGTSSTLLLRNRSSYVCFSGGSSCGGVNGVDYAFNAWMSSRATLSGVPGGWMLYGYSDGYGAVYDGTAGGYVWRYTDTNNFIGVLPGWKENGRNNVYTKVVGGTKTLLLNVAPAFNSPPTWDPKTTHVLAVATTHYLWRNNVLVGTPITISDAALQDGKVWMWGGNTATSDSWLRLHYVSVWPTTMTLSIFTNSFSLSPP